MPILQATDPAELADEVRQRRDVEIALQQRRHGADVCDPVWDLLEYTYARLGPVPTLLERDFNIPPLNTLVREVERVRQLQGKHRVGAPPDNSARGQASGATVAAKAAPTMRRRA